MLVTYWEPCIFGQSRIGIRTKGWRSYIKEFRGSEAVEDFCYKLIYGDCRVQGQRFCIRSETSLYYSGFLFGKVSPQVFYCETSLFHWFSQVIISCLIYYFAVLDIDISFFYQGLFIINLINNLSLKLVNSINRGPNFPTMMKQTNIFLPWLTVKQVKVWFLYLIIMLLK